MDTNPRVPTSLPKGWREALREVHRYANDSNYNWKLNPPTGGEVLELVMNLARFAPEIPPWVKAVVQLQTWQLGMVYNMAVGISPGENLAELAHAGVTFADEADQLLVATSTLESCYDFRHCRPGNCPNLCITKAET
jgi:hypothetical protein